MSMKSLKTIAACAMLMATSMGASAADDKSGPVVQFNFDGDINPEPSGGYQIEAIGTPRFSPGKHGQAVELAKDSKLRLRLKDAIAKGEFTIAFWMKPHWHWQDNLAHPVYELDAEPDSYDEVGWSPGQLLFSKGWSESINPNGFYGVSMMPPPDMCLQPEVWTHVVVTYSADGKFSGSYFNGSGGRKQAEPKVIKGHQSLWLGCRTKGFGCGDVAVDDLRIYSRVVDPVEIPGIAGEKLPEYPDIMAEGRRCDSGNFVKTPHLKWGRPLSGGTLKVLFIGEGARMRDCFELAQRLDIEPVILASPRVEQHAMVNPENFKKISDALEASLKSRRPDAVVLAAYAWNLLEPSARGAIMDYVKSGGGLLLASPRCVNVKGANKSIGHGSKIGWRGTELGAEMEKLLAQPLDADAAWLLNGTPWNALALFDMTLRLQPPDTFFRVGRIDKGRLLAYDFNAGGVADFAALRPVGEGDLFDYDYALAAAAKALLWVCGRDETVRVDRVRFVSENSFFRDPTVGLNGDWLFSLVNRTKDKLPVEVELTVRGHGPDVPTVSKRKVTLEPGFNEIRFPVVLDRIGTQFADLRVLRDGKVVDWGTGVVTTKGGHLLTSISQDKPCYHPGDSPIITAKITYRDGKMKGGILGTVKWRLFDAYDREVARDAVPIEFNVYDERPAECAWRLPPLERSSLNYRLIVDLEQGGKKTDQGTLTLLNKRMEDDGFNFFVWGDAADPVSGLALALARDKYNLVSARPKPNRSAIEGMNRLNLRSWPEIAYLGNGSVGEDGRRTHDMADELWLSQLGESVQETARMAEPYSPLFYSLGDEIRPGDPNAQASEFENAKFKTWLREKYKTAEEAAQALGMAWKSWDDAVVPTRADLLANKAPKLVPALRLFRQELFAAMIGRCVESVRKAAPDAKCGIEGIFGLEHGWGSIDYRAVAKNSTFMGLYAILDYNMEFDMARSFQRPDSMLGCWFNYQLYNPGYSRAGPWEMLMGGVNAFGWFCSYDGSWYSLFNPDFTPTYNFKNTAEELTPIMEGVGDLVLSMKRHDMGVRVLFNFANLNRSGHDYLATKQMYFLLNDAGVQFDYIGAEDVATGALSSNEVKLLVIAGQSIVDKKAADAILRFVAEGGAALGDICPEALSKLTTEPGKGQVKFLGKRLDWYMRGRFGQEGADARAAVQAFTMERKLNPACSLRPVDGVFRPVAKVDYVDGASRCSLILRDYRAKDLSSADFEFSGYGKSHVYDSRAGKYLGQADKAVKSLEPARGALLAYLPCKVTGLRIEGIRTECRFGDELPLRLSLDIEGPAPGIGMFRIDVAGPDGVLVPALCRNVRSLGGVAKVPVRMAFNDQPGQWTVTVRDVATGVVGKATFNLKK